LPPASTNRGADCVKERWLSGTHTRLLGYADYRNFEQVIGKARLACFNSGQRIEDHFVAITEMIENGKKAILQQ